MSANPSFDEFFSAIQEVIERYGTLNYLYSNKPDFRKGIDTVYYSGPFWDHREIQAIFQSVLGGKWLSSGEQVAEFERKFAKEIGMKHSLMVNSGSSANLVMFAALKSKLNLTPENSQILTAVAGFPTTVNPALQYGFQPTFIDVEDSSLNIDMDLLEKVIDPSKEHHILTIAHVLGNPPDLDRLRSIMDVHGIHFLEDACDALGTKWNAQPIGSFGLLSTCSFYPSHHVCTCEGGAVSTSDDELADIIRRIAWWGRDCYCVGAANLLPHGTCKRRFSNWLESRPDLLVDHKYVFTELGYNLKPLDLQGAIGLVQLQKLPEIHAKRKKAYEVMSSIFGHYGDVISTAAVDSRAEVSWFGFPVICRDRELKMKLVDFLERSRIQTRNYFAGNLLCHPAYAKYGNWREYPVANTIYEKVFFVGCHPGMGDAHFDYVREVLRTFFG